MKTLQILILTIATLTCHASWVDESGCIRMGDPSPEQQAAIDAKGRADRGEVLTFKVGTKREDVEKSLKKEPYTEITSSGGDFITYLTHIHQEKIEKIPVKEAPAPTDSIITHTGRGEYTVTQVPSQSSFVILGGREGKKEVYADGTVHYTRGQFEEKKSTVDIEVKSQVFFKDGKVEIYKELSRKNLK